MPKWRQRLEKHELLLYLQPSRREAVLNGKRYDSQLGACEMVTVGIEIDAGIALAHWLAKSLNHGS